MCGAGVVLAATGVGLAGAYAPLVALVGETGAIAIPAGFGLAGIVLVAGGLFA